jgi:two-component system, NtrC family, nitrogen regulation response regulator NtrX
VFVPPLRERREDIPLLAAHFVHLMTSRDGVPVRELTPEALARLEELDWPGNVRELRNTVERLLILSAGDRVEVRDVETLVSGKAGPQGLGEELLRADTFQDFKERSERAFLLQRLRDHVWNVSETARVLEMPRSNLYKKIERFGLNREE